MGEGAMPALAALRDRSARVRLDHGAAVRTGLAWEHFWSGRSPDVTHRSSVVEFEPGSYSVWQSGARFAPFFSSLDIRSVVFDPPYADLGALPASRASSRGAPTTPGSTPRGPTRRPCSPNSIGGSGPTRRPRATTPSPGRPSTRHRAMARGLVEGCAARTEAARWLLTERIPDWDLAIVSASEPHSAAEGLWHGVDAGHPLHSHPSAAAAAEGVAEVYRATDRMIGELVDAIDPTTVVVFALGGMGINGSDVPSMGLLPELLFRWSFGAPLLQVPPEFSDAPLEVPLARREGDSGWQRAWFERAERRSRARALVRHLPEPVLAPVRRARSRRRDRHEPVGFANLGWHPATWYRPWWPRMRAFALPSFSPGRIRVNLRGRERDGIVDASDYERVCDDLERLVAETRDPRTGEPVARVVERPGRTADPRRCPGSEADLVVVWRGSTLAFEHPEHGLVGPLPYRRTGGHSGPYGFAYFAGRGLEPGDHGVTSTFDVAPTLAGLVAGHAVDGISGTALRLDNVPGRST